MNRNVLLTSMTLAFALMSQSGMAANANTSQKGSLLVFPKIDVRDGMTTWVRLVNDYKTPVTVKCYYMDVDKHRVDFEFPLTKNQPITFDAATGYGPSRSVNSFPHENDKYPLYGELICFAVNDDGTQVRNYNYLSGTATVASKKDGVSEYNAWSFRLNGEVPSTNTDLILGGNTVGVYDSCPAYLLGQFSPAGSPAPGGAVYGATTLDISSCRQDLRQDFDRNNTKLQFDVWKSDETRLTGAYHCANSFAETTLDGIDMASQNFSASLLRDAAYYRVQGVQSDRCDDSVGPTTETGLLGVQTSLIPNVGAVSTELTGSNFAAKPGFIKWDAVQSIEAPRR